MEELLIIVGFIVYSVVKTVLDGKKEEDDSPQESSRSETASKQGDKSPARPAPSTVKELMEQLREAGSAAASSMENRPEQRADTVEEPETWKDAQSPQRKRDSWIAREEVHSPHRRSDKVSHKRPVERRIQGTKLRQAVVLREILNPPVGIQ
ncbi:hypothetical protein [Chitinivibrio alkaliphilus]|uniref:Uncharacterized protein n=1 Tax=Chitinivibrio alkaliphilus ACht1 TaxID=1313304 RepID=U7D3H8_9BACT|nr:hypothetical protein [Chitinivibrio alkaliphilus]ERP31059.1 hypothetical protein CALK_2088 [Chitinivibrio alkaliphilus ACht1]